MMEKIPIIVTTFCPQTQKPARIALEVDRKMYALTVTGKPVSCNFEREACRQSVKCLLNACKLTTRRK